MKVAEASFNFGFPKPAYVGSCALIAIISGNKLYVANSGDCKGVLISKNEAGDLITKDVSKTFSANKSYE